MSDERNRVKWKSVLIDTLVNTLYEGYDIIGDVVAAAASAALVATGGGTIAPQVIEEAIDQYMITHVKRFMVERLPDIYERLGERWTPEERERRRRAYGLGYGIERAQVIPGTDVIPGSFIGELILYGGMYAPALIERIRRRARNRTEENLKRRGLRLGYAQA